MLNDKPVDTERIELLRGGSLISSLAGAFGATVKETRLTAMLGYLIALDSSSFVDVFGFTGKVGNVKLEHRHGNNRSDILIETIRR
jgi:hypothetical protein